MVLEARIYLCFLFDLNTPPILASRTIRRYLRGMGPPFPADWGESVGPGRPANKYLHVRRHGHNPYNLTYNGAKLPASTT